MKDNAAAEPEFRTAIRVEPNDARLYKYLGDALMAQGKVDLAAAEFREAIRLKPDFAGAHFELARTFAYHGQAELAAAQYREVIRLKPDSAEAHCNLGDALNNQGDYAGALAMVRRGHELGTKQPGWRYPSAKWVAEAETRMAIAGRFAAMLKGEDSPKHNNERLVFAEIADGHKKFATATRLYLDAYAADPKAAEGMHTGNRYTAACAAAQAGSGLGDDAPPEESERARHRRLALSWLRDHLVFMAKHLEANTPSAQVDVQRWLLSWQTDRDLAGIRDQKELAKLPEAERKEWQALWAQVDAMLKRVREPKP